MVYMSDEFRSLVESLKGRDDVGHMVVGRRIILNWS
jgi:hypothetical protein